MISKELYETIQTKYGHYASWAVWAKEGEKPKDNMGDTSIFNLEKNSEILNTLNPNIILIALNISRPLERKTFRNFHDSNPRAQDYKLRDAIKGTRLWGAYMTDIIKDFEEKASGKMMKYLNSDKEFEKENINSFLEELATLQISNPILVALGNDVHKILTRNLEGKYPICKITHYSGMISIDNYRKEVDNLIQEYNL